MKHTSVVSLMTVLAFACHIWSSEEQYTSKVDKFSHRFQKRQTDESSSCPIDSSIILPCTCTKNRTSVSSYPELSCVNYGGGSEMQLDDICENLKNYLERNDEIKVYKRLLLVNSHLKSLNKSVFRGLKFQNMEIYETNLTTFDSNTFEDMGDTLTYLLFKGNELTDSIFPSLNSLRLLKYLVLKLGVNSFESIPSSGVTGMSELRRVSISGVAKTIKTSAFSNLTSVSHIKISNQLEQIESLAFMFPDDVNQMNITIDLSNNKLDENSFASDFIRYRPNVNIELDLDDNWVRYLPQNVFQSFFSINPGNHLHLRNNKFECGRCESFWLVANHSMYRNQIDLTCNMNQSTSVWDFDWSHCQQTEDNTTSSASARSMFALVLAVCVAVQCLAIL